MSDNFKKILVAIAGALTSLVIAVVLSFIAGQKHAQKSLILPQKERVDTLVIRDTITEYKPIVEERVVLQKYPVMVEKYDTIMRHDTIYLNMQREQVVWKDKYAKVYASGIMPHVDSVEHYLERHVITKERDVIVKVKPKWSIGVHAGYGAFVKNGQIATSPYIGVGVSYNILSW